jgi:hypothetical protein
MSKHRGDEAEYAPGRVPDARDPAQPSLFAETQEYLKGARERITTLTPVDELKGQVDAVPKLTVREAVERMAQSAFPGAQVTEDPEGGPMTLVLPPELPTKRRAPRKGMVRDRDHGTSIDAAKAVEPVLSELQLQVEAAFVTLGAMTDKELEHLPHFEKYEYSTVRKRRTELVTMGRLASVKEADGFTPKRKDGLKLWDLAWRCTP